MSTTTPAYFDLYNKASTRCNEYAFAIGWAQGSIKHTVLSLETILKTKMTQAEKARAIRQQIAELEQIIKDINDPATLLSKSARRTN